MDEIHYLLEIAKDLLEILVLILTARQLTKKKKHKKKKYVPGGSKVSLPLQGILLYHILRKI